MKRNKGLFAVLVLALLVGGILSGAGKMTVRGEEKEPFSIHAEMLPSDKETYDIRVTVENLGADWEGTVRLKMDEDYRRPSAYDTILSLARGSRKQFTVRVPRNSVESSEGDVTIGLFNKRNHKVAEKQFKRLLSEEMDALSMGILSDEYSTLTYLDMGGQTLYYYGTYYPIRLVELHQDDLTDSLDGLTFLVIDQYHTDVLTQEQLQEIENWNDGGGVLIIGTGTYGEDTLGGFEDSYLEAGCTGVYKPDDVAQYGAGSYADMSLLPLAKLQVAGYDQNYYTGSFSMSVGDGSVSILPYALTQLGCVDADFYLADTQEGFVQQILEEASCYAASRYAAAFSGSAQNLSYTIRRMLGVLGNSNSRLQFGVLKAVIVLYVILVGPVLYLVLKGMKKRELYWVAVPLMAFVGIGVIFLAGRGFEVVDTRVYSVTVEELSGGGDLKTYLYCYDAGHNEWGLRMAEGYEYAGTLENYSYYDTMHEDAYYYHIKKDGEVLSLGVNPDANFEDTYFYVGGAGDSPKMDGTVRAENITADWMGIDGTITNETDRDFVYFAVIVGDRLYLYHDLPAGESCRLREKAVFYEDNGDIRNNYQYHLLNDSYEEGDREKTGALAALGIGICAADARMDHDTVMVIGVTDDWPKTVDDTCSETSYGCLYRVW